MATAPAPGEVPGEEEEKRPTIDIFGPIRWLGEQIANAFKGFIEYIAEGLVRFWLKTIPAKEILPKEIYSSLTTTTPEWAKPLVNELTHHFIRQAEDAVRSAVESNPYIDKRVEEDVINKIKTFLLPASIAIIASSVAAQLAELLHPLRELRVGETVRDVTRAIGLTKMVDSMFSVIYGDIFIQPLKYDMNYLVRPWLPPQNIVDTMFFQDAINEEKWTDYYRRIGWQEDYIDAWRKARYQPPSIWLLYRLMENPNIPDEWYDKVLRYHRLDEEDRAVLKEAFRWYSLKDEIYRYRDTVVNYFKKGLVSKVELMEELSSLPLSKDVIDYTIRLAEYTRDKELKEERINAIREGFRKGKITELEYINMLRDEGVESDVIESWLTLDKVKRKVELRKTVVSLSEVG